MINVRAIFVPVLALGLLAAACGGDDDDGTEELPEDRDELSVEPEETVAEEAEPPPDVLREGLQVTSVDFTTGVAVITNNGDRDIDLAGHWICNRPSYAEMPNQVLTPGDSVEASLGGFSPDGGEVAIYTSDAFGDSTAIATYVSWGSGGGRDPVAKEAGIWEGAPVQVAGDTIELTGEPGSADGWS